ncbi:hypothetical protein A2T76_24655 [Pseudomonas brenneri]|nr:hypothetical protein A2T76_24655 [Pseudomonas brenneri]
MWSQVAVAQVALWLIVALLMVWASLYSVEHLAQMYVFERLSNIVDLSNGNFSGFEPGMLSELKTMGNYEASVEEWPSLLAKSYAFIEYCILLSMSLLGYVPLSASIRFSVRSIRITFQCKQGFAEAWLTVS